MLVFVSIVIDDPIMMIAVVVIVHLPAVMMVVPFAHFVGKDRGIHPGTAAIDDPCTEVRTNDRSTAAETLRSKAFGADEAFLCFQRSRHISPNTPDGDGLIQMCQVIRSCGLRGVAGTV
ncbi:MAG: hypothetical protein IPI95_10970 [Flavobacteriales bacterium]|nr:hypothetical protein [Flavobacteriales bacterium]